MAAGGAGGGFDPLHQFEVSPLIGQRAPCVDADGAVIEGCSQSLPFYSFTNSALFMVVGLLLVVTILSFGLRRGAMVPGRWQSLAEVAYEFIANMIRDNVGTEGRKYFPFIFTLFMFVLAGNFIGMVPYTFTYTSHIVVTFMMAAFVFISVTVIGFAKHGVKFFGLFLPAGVPIAMAPLLIPIELLSYLTRPVSLALRLFANMTAGHTMLKVFASFIPQLGIVGGIVPLALVTGLTGLEFIIAFLQAYVFTILSCVYLNDALHLH